MEAKEKEHFYKIAYYLGYFTIFYNLIEGIISVYFGFEDESLTLFGFGVDSFIEMLSGIGITHMIFRMKKNQFETIDKFEITALKITGSSFYLFTIGILVTSFYNLITDKQPISSFWGIVISLISILVMIYLLKRKNYIGKKLNSEPIIADANCTKVCIYMSVILLVSSGIYELTHFAFTDTIGSIGLGYFSYKEGKECFEKANGKLSCNC